MLRISMIVLAALTALLLVAAVLAWYVGTEQFDRRLNRGAADPQAPVPTAEDRAFHRSLFVADLHADTLKWDRDLLERAAWGHLDVPRMVEGNVGLQVFTIVTQSPIPGTRKGHPGERCVSSASVDVAAVPSAVQGRPVFSQRERALFQIQRLKDAAARSRTVGGPEAAASICGPTSLPDAQAAQRDPLGNALHRQQQ
ncbi:MAG TPA: hypothetical protein VD995_22660 [Azospirillum sp.]|nr:hypothetical protein [Azospirillum sp.]